MIVLYGVTANYCLEEAYERLCHRVTLNSLIKRNPSLSTPSVRFARSRPTLEESCKQAASFTKPNVHCYKSFGLNSFATFSSHCHSVLGVAVSALFCCPGNCSLGGSSFARYLQVTAIVCFCGPCIQSAQ